MTQVKLTGLVVSSVFLLLSLLSPCPLWSDRPVVELRVRDARGSPSSDGRSGPRLSARGLAVVVISSVARTTLNHPSPLPSFARGGTRPQRQLTGVETGKGPSSAGSTFSSVACPKEGSCLSPTKQEELNRFSPSRVPPLLPRS